MNKFLDGLRFIGQTGKAAFHVTLAEHHLRKGNMPAATKQSGLTQKALALADKHLTNFDKAQ